MCPVLHTLQFRTFYFIEFNPLYRKGKWNKKVHDFQWILLSFCWIIQKTLLMIFSHRRDKLPYNYLDMVSIKNWKIFLWLKKFQTSSSQNVSLIRLLTLANLWWDSPTHHHVIKNCMDDTTLCLIRRLPRHCNGTRFMHKSWKWIQMPFSWRFTSCLSIEIQTLKIWPWNDINLGMTLTSDKSNHIKLMSRWQN